MKKWVAKLLVVAMVLAGALSGVALADSSGTAETPSKYQVDVTLDPRFPIAGQEATLTLRISHDGKPEEGLDVALALAHVEAQDNHGAKGQDNHDEDKEAVTETGGMAGMGEEKKVDPPKVVDNPGGGQPEPAKASGAHSETGNASGSMSAEQDEESEEHAKATARAVEVAPGVYVAKYAFSEGGKWEVKAEMGDGHADLVVGVRSAPVAWPLLGGMGALVIATAVMVTAVKTTKKEW